jgi:glycosyltransferase involved in cell wall biosynthesis
VRILWLNHYSPWPPFSGGKIRTTNLVKRLAAAGDEIVMWCVSTEPQVQPDPPLKTVTMRFFPQRPRATATQKLAALASPLPSPAWVLRSPEVLQAFRDVGGFDVAVVDHAHMGALSPELDATGIPWVFDAANVEHSVLTQISRSLRNPVTRTRFTLDAAKFRRLETRLVTRASASVAVSAEDAQRLEALHPGSKVETIQTGVDLGYFPFVDHSKPKGANLVLTGTLGYYPNLDAGLWLVREIMPRVRARIPNATLALVGGPVPAELAHIDPATTGVNVVGPVPDVRPYLAAADLFVVPLRLGGGIRLKALESLASGLPMVATPLAVEGVGIIENDLALIANDADGIAAAIQRGLTDVSLRERLVREGRRHIEERFDFDRIAEAFRATLARIAR